MIRFSRDSYRQVRTFARIDFLDIVDQPRPGGSSASLKLSGRFPARRKQSDASLGLCTQFFRGPGGRLRSFATRSWCSSSLENERLLRTTIRQGIW